jgi:hypothetical protein
MRAKAARFHKTILPQDFKNLIAAPAYGRGYAATVHRGGQESERWGFEANRPESGETRGRHARTAPAVRDAASRTVGV